MRFSPFFILMLLSGCTTSQKDTVERPLPEILKKAERLMAQGSYEKASDEFDEIERQHPYSELVPQTQLRAALCAYKAKSYERAITGLDTFITLNPVSPSLDYAYFLRALCYEAEVGALERDQEHTQQAQEAFESVVKMCPQSPYAKEARVKIQALSEQLMAKEFMVASSYMHNEDLIGSMVLFAGFIKKYPQSRLWPEAMYRFLELQTRLGLDSGKENVYRTLVKSYPHDKWTKKSQDLLKKFAK